ncbi:MAG TPA: hypothetical protein VM889_06335 [Candidatus Thermoplasmatota archaeon]|nr:hypothetical protein [Candidatus Thermoplasmatota archaeon]
MPALWRRVGRGVAAALSGLLLVAGLLGLVIETAALPLATRMEPEDAPALLIFAGAALLATTVGAVALAASLIGPRGMLLGGSCAAVVATLSAFFHAAELRALARVAPDDAARDLWALAAGLDGGAWMLLLAAVVLGVLFIALERSRPGPAPASG